jgi:hypothetical protein
MGKKIFLKTAIIILSSIKYNKFKNHLLYKKNASSSITTSIVLATIMLVN